MTLPAVELSAD
jgi:hypothetical protein